MKCKNCKEKLTHGNIEHNKNPFCSYKCIVIYDSKPKEEKIGWDIVEQEITKNKQPRINWKVILGMSLTRAIARFKAAGLTSELTYETICLEHKEQLTEEMKRKLKIGVAARFGEMATSQSELKKKK